MVLGKMRLWILNRLAPITRYMGRLHAPFSHTRVTGLHYHQLMNRLRPGMVLVSRRRGEVSNLFIPGGFTHAAIYVGKQMIRVGDEVIEAPVIMEAIGIGVIATPLASFMLTKDRIAVLEPAFAGEDVMERAADIAMGYEGTPYDYLFARDHRAFYCSELVFVSYREAAGTAMTFVEREVLGIPTIAPADFYEATNHWRLVWESEKIKLEVAGLALSA